MSRTFCLTDKVNRLVHTVGKVTSNLAAPPISPSPLFRRAEADCCYMPITPSTTRVFIHQCHTAQQYPTSTCLLFESWHGLLAAKQVPNFYVSTRLQKQYNL